VRRDSLTACGGTEELVEGLDHRSDAHTNGDHRDGPHSGAEGVLNLQILASVLELQREGRGAQGRGADRRHT
jgi:hypothetical protein